MDGNFQAAFEDTTFFWNVAWNSKYAVIPTKVKIQVFNKWIPTFARMTMFLFCRVLKDSLKPLQNPKINLHLVIPANAGIQ